MAKYNFNLRDSQSNKETPINLVIRFNNQRLVYPSGESISPKNWNKKTQRAKETKQFPEYPEFNSHLDSIEAIAKTVYRTYLNDHNNEFPERHEFKKLLDEKFKRVSAENLKDFFTFIEDYINKAENKTNEQTGKSISKNTIKKYKTTQRHLLDFQKKYKRNLTFKTMDLDFYHDFTAYLTKDLNLSTNTVGKYIQTLKSFLNDARDRGFNEYTQYKSPRFKVLSEESVSTYLNESELEKVYKLDLTAHPRLDRVRDLFLIGCYTGLRFSDFTQIEPENLTSDNKLIIKTQKTGETIKVPLHSVVKEILKKYNNNLPRSISNQKMNDYLKEIMQRVPELKEPIVKSITKGGMTITKDIERWTVITSHTARRSFATNLYLSGFPSLKIMAITGHKTETSFLKYIKITKDEIANDLELHWNKIG